MKKENILQVPMTEQLRTDFEAVALRLSELSGTKVKMARLARIVMQKFIDDFKASEGANDPDDFLNR